MTTDSNASKTNELMKDGIRQVRDGRYTDAYRTFREVINLDPNNEHAWIWISQTSTDLTERRTALNRAFEINPSSEYAKQALTRLELEESAATNPAPPVRPGVIGGEEAPGQVGGAVRLSKQSADDPNDLRSAIGDGGKKKGKGRGKEPKEVDPRSSGSLRQNPKMVTQSTGKPKGGKRFRLIALVVLGLVVVVTVVVVLVVSPQTPPPSANTTPPSAEATTVDTTTPSAEATTAGATTAAAVAVVPATTPPEATTVASANPSPAVTITSSLTASPATTNSAGDVGLAATPTQVSSNVTATVGVTGTLGVATISGSAITGTTTVSGTASVAPVAATSVTSGTAVTGTTTVSGTASVAPVATVVATSVAPVAT
ncbi:MAG: tetratricopeptide repeat protein, partial [Chloroflexota bacterium]